MRQLVLQPRDIVQRHSDLSYDMWSHPESLMLVMQAREPFEEAISECLIKAIQEAQRLGFDLSAPTIEFGAGDGYLIRKLDGSQSEELKNFASGITPTDFSEPLLAQIRRGRGPRPVKFDLQDFEAYPGPMKGHTQAIAMSVFDTLTELHRVCQEMRNAGIEKFLHLQDLMPLDHSVALRWSNEGVVLIPYYERVANFELYSGFLVFNYEELVTYLSHSPRFQNMIPLVNLFKRSPTETLYSLQQRGIEPRQFSSLIEYLPLEREIIRIRDAFFIDFIQTLMSVGYKVEFFQTSAQVTLTDQRASQTDYLPEKLSLRGGFQVSSVIVQKGAKSCVEVVMDIIYAYI